MQNDDSLEKFLKERLDDPEYGGRSPCCHALIDVDVEEVDEEEESIRWTCSRCGKNLIEGEAIPAWYLLKDF